VYSQEHLAVRRLKRKRLVRPAPEGTLLSRPNQESTIDFVVDSFTRECPAIEVDTGLSIEHELEPPDFAAFVDRHRA
jgi:hypothetical protein